MDFMQNSTVAKPPERPKPADAKPAAPRHDFSLDPLPVPDATESDGDTVWGLWQETLQAQDEAQDPPPTDFADTVLSQDSAYGTLPAELVPEGKKQDGKKPGKSEDKKS